MNFHHALLAKLVLCSQMLRGARKSGSGLSGSERLTAKPHVRAALTHQRDNIGYGDALCAPCRQAFMHDFRKHTPNRAYLSRVSKDRRNTSLKTTLCRHRFYAPWRRHTSPPRPSHSLSIVTEDARSTDIGLKIGVGNSTSDIGRWKIRRWTLDIGHWKNKLPRERRCIASSNCDVNHCRNSLNHLQTGCKPFVSA